MILGSWTRNETFGNFSYIIDYTFYSNKSFFSGIKEVGEDTYNITIRGNYNIDNENIQFITDGKNPSNSTQKYSISNEEDLLLLYYEDEINYDVLRRKN
jgi:hypothetical protein